MIFSATQNMYQFSHPADDNADTYIIYIYIYIYISETARGGHSSNLMDMGPPHTNLENSIYRSRYVSFAMLSLPMYYKARL